MKQFIKKIISFVIEFFTPARLAVAAVVFIFLGFVAIGDKGIGELRSLMDMKHKLTAERIKLNDDIDKLSKEKEILLDPKNLEMTIRKEMGYIKPGEIVFEKKKTETR